jgi:thiamine kinase-like enzyme
MIVDDIKWCMTGHKKRRYDLRVSCDGKYFKKSTNRLHDTLEMELFCLEKAKSRNLNRMQRLVEGIIDKDNTSYIVTESCGRGLTRGSVPDNWKEQLDEIDEQLNILEREFKIYHNDVQMRNMFSKNKYIMLLDFDLATTNAPNRRATKRPGFLRCDLVRDKIQNDWNIK